MTEQFVPGKNEERPLEEAEEAMRRRAEGGDVDAAAAVGTSQNLVESALDGTLAEQVQDSIGNMDFLKALKQIGHELLRKDDTDGGEQGQA